MGEGSGGVCHVVSPCRGRRGDAAGAVVAIRDIRGIEG
jgi:hypothetical protein